MGILDKILGALLALAIMLGAASLWYADHEHARIKPLEEQVTLAQQRTVQAQADRDTAIRAAEAAQRQLAAADAAVSQAQAAAARATAQAANNKRQLDHIASAPTAQKLLNTPVPVDVWNAIYNSGK